MDDSLTLEALRTLSIDIQPHEAVAVAQALIRREPECVAHATYGPLSLDTIAVDERGGVLCLGHAATPSVAEVAIVLQQLLSNPGVRVPGGLRYCVSRALHEVDAPPFDSVEQFSRALERFEHGEPRAALAGLHARAVERLRERRHPTTALRLTPRVDADLAPEPDRRSSGPTVSDLRRQLRDADLRAFASSRPAGTVARVPRPRRHAPLAACLLAGVSLVAVGAAAHRGHTGSSARADSAHVDSPVSTPGIATADPAPMRADAPVMADDARTTSVPASSVHIAARQPRRAVDEPRAPVRRMRPGPVRARPTHDKGLLHIRFVWDNPFR
jgi:hypothetical protein